MGAGAGVAEHRELRAAAAPGWDALQAALADWRVGRGSWETWGDAADGCRRVFARLVEVPASDVAIGARSRNYWPQWRRACRRVPRWWYRKRSSPPTCSPGWSSPSAGFGAHGAAGPARQSVEARTDLVAFSLVQSADGRIARV